MIAALETYDKTTVTKILANDALTGAVMGDLFCTRRMFAGGETEQWDRMRQLKDGGKAVWFQTPCYLTDPTLQRTVQQVEYAWNIGMLDGVLLQDVGLLRILAHRLPDIPLIWSILGIARNGAVNLMQYQFLRSLGPVRVATARPDHGQFLLDHGIPAALLYGRMSFATVNRLCYNTYESGQYGTDCGRACLTDARRMHSAESSLDLTLDGYLLGRTYQYGPAAELLSVSRASGSPLLVYARDYDDCLERLESLGKEESNEAISCDPGIQ